MVICGPVALHKSAALIFCLSWDDNNKWWQTVGIPGTAMTIGAVFYMVVQMESL